MKRFICTFLVLCMIPVIAFGSTIDDMNLYARVLNAPEIDTSIFQKEGNKIVYNTEIGFLGIEEDGTNAPMISVSGKGDLFLKYAISAICILEGSNVNLTENCGLLLSTYILMKEDSRTMMTKGGCWFIIQPYNDGYMFIVTR